MNINDKLLKSMTNAISIVVWEHILDSLVKVFF